MSAEVLTNAESTAKFLNDLNAEASAVLIDPSKEMTLVTSTKDIAPILAQARKLAGSISGSLALLLK